MLSTTRPRRPTGPVGTQREPLHRDKRDHVLYAAKLSVLAVEKNRVHFRLSQFSRKKPFWLFGLMFLN